MSDGNGTPTSEPEESPAGSATPPAGAAATEAPPVTGDTPPATGGASSDESIGELVFQISDRASVLIREEIELAKTEVTEKVNRLLRGSVVGLVAGVFVLLALAMIMHGVAWLLNDLFFEDDVWAGFLVEAGGFLLLAAVGGLIAYRSFKQGAPPTPDMAIEEAKEIKAAFDGDDDDDGAEQAEASLTKEDDK